MERPRSWYPPLKAYIDRRALLSCLLALALAGCAVQRTAQAPGPAAAPAAAPSQAFLGEYEEALVLMRTGRYEQAGTKLAALTRRYPDLAGPYVNLGLTYLHLERGEDAETALVAAADRNPHSVVAQTLLGVVYREEGRFEDARRAYQRALALDADYAEAHLNLGILLDLYLRQPEEALKHYERYREIRPSDAARVEPWITDLRRNGAYRAGGSGS